MPTASSRSDALASSATAEVREQIALLWNARLTVVATAVALAVFGAAVSLFSERKFEAVTVVAVSTARLTSQPAAPAAPDSFVPLMSSQAIAAKVIADLKLDGYSPSDLLSTVVTVRAVTATNLIVVSARMTTPDQAASVSNRFAEEAVLAANRVSRIDVDAVEGQLKTMLDQAAQRLAAAEKAYDEYRIGARYELVEREVETLVGQRRELLDVLVDLEGEKARLARLDGDLSRLTPVTALKDSVVNAPALAEVARRAGETPRELTDLQMQREEPSTTYANLSEEAAKTRANVAALEQRRQRLEAAVGVKGNRLGTLSEFYERASRLEHLEGERRIAQDAYADVADRYHGSSLAAVGRAPQLLVVDPAPVPDRPMSRYLTRNVVLGFVVGAVLASMTLLLRAALAPPAA